MRIYIYMVFKRNHQVFCFFFFLTWDSFCLLYWRGSYFLTNVSSGKFFFWEEKWGRFIVYIFFFLTSPRIFFFLTTHGDFFMLLNRSRSLLEAGRYIKKIQKVSYCFFFLVKNTPKLINQQLKNWVKIVN